MVDVKWITRNDGDWGSHCNSCEHIAEYIVSVKSLSFRLCQSCADILSVKIDSVLIGKTPKSARKLTPRAADAMKPRR